MAAEDRIRAVTQAVDEDYIATMGMRLLSGRNFESAVGATAVRPVIVNEATVRSLGWPDPIGERIKLEGWDWEGEVIGVVEDFHGTSLRSRIGPWIMHNDRRTFWDLAVRVESGGLEETLTHLETQWKRFNDFRTFRYSFLSDRIERMYIREQRQTEVMCYASGMAIFVAGLGILGLASFSVERRSHEIGIRKVLGASRAGITKLLSTEMILLTITAFLVSLPAAYLFANEWLQSYAYRFSPGVAVYVAGGVISLILATGVVGWQSLRASDLNPVDTIRHS